MGVSFFQSWPDPPMALRQLQRRTVSLPASNVRRWLQDRRRLDMMDTAQSTQGHSAAAAAAAAVKTERGVCRTWQAAQESSLFWFSNCASTGHPSTVQSGCIGVVSATVLGRRCSLCHCPVQFFFGKFRFFSENISGNDGPEILHPMIPKTQNL